MLYLNYEALQFARAILEVVIKVEEASKLHQIPQLKKLQGI